MLLIFAFRYRYYIDNCKNILWIRWGALVDDAVDNMVAVSTEDGSQHAAVFAHGNQGRSVIGRA